MLNKMRSLLESMVAECDSSMIDPYEMSPEWVAIYETAKKLIAESTADAGERRKQILGIPCRCVSYSNPKTQAAYEEGFCDALQAAANYANVDRQLAEAGIDMEPAFKRLHAMIDKHRAKSKAGGTNA